jgi:4-hydroxythreonine-4-phosphate dehydrogenase
LLDAIKRVKKERIEEVIELTWQTMRTLGKANKPLAVAGLNPHAGEGGLFGDEEIQVISPAVREAARQGVHVSGPFPPDTIFYWALKGKWDAVVCMYHDQGLIPFKMLHFQDGVNTTLGLPIVRTSVDHGTAYDIAGTGQADSESLIAAIVMAAHQAVERAKNRRATS